MIVFLWLVVVGIISLFFLMIQKQEILGIDQDAFWQYEKTLYGTIQYKRMDEEYVPWIVEIIEQYYPLLLEDFQCRDEKNFSIVIYPQKEMLKKKFKITTSKVPMGAYYKGQIYILSPRVWMEGSVEEQKQKFMREGPVLHEMVHWLIDEQTKKRVPHWLNEGMALYYEYKYMGVEWGEHLSMEQMEKSREITMEELKNSFFSLNEVLVYRRSFEMVRDWIQEHGEEALHQKVLSFYN